MRRVTHQPRLHNIEGTDRRSGTPALPSLQRPARRIVQVLDVAADRYSLAPLEALTGVAVAHRRLGPSSSAIVRS
jgi:hypothetical protein